MYKNNLIGALLFPLALGSCGSTKIAVRAMPVPETMRVSDSEGLSKGRMLFERGEYALAADAFRRAVRQNPESGDAYNGLAASYDQLGRYDLSRRYYELALAQAPEDGRILRNFARSMLSQGDRLTARKLMAEAAALDHARPAQATISPEPQPDEMAQAVPVEKNRPYESGQGNVTIALAPEPVALASVGLPAQEPVTPAPSLFRRIAATVIHTFPGADDSVNVALDPPPHMSVQTAARKFPRLHIMNAVGRKHQAARMSSYLAGNGWMGVSTGDSRSRLSRSRILFRSTDEVAARKLAASLPFQPRLLASPRAPALFLVLGRDAVEFDNQLRAPKQS
jgi:hypothetical protein